MVFLSLSLACSRLNPATSAWLGNDLELSVAFSKAQYLPGEPVVAKITLANTARSSVQAIPSLDHVSVSFSVQRQLKNEPDDLKFVTPVFSDKEEAGARIILQPRASNGSTVSRDFVFTTLSFERGPYLLTATYTRPSESPVKPSRKTFAKPVAFTVAGEKAFAHRYIDGLLSREDAVKLASAKAGVPVKTADTLLIVDEAGFQKWWVNLTLEGGQGVKSWFVDPCFAQVWKEARPFTPADKGVEPQPDQDAKFLQHFKDQDMNNRAQ